MVPRQRRAQQSPSPPAAPPSLQATFQIPYASVRAEPREALEQRPWRRADPRHGPARARAPGLMCFFVWAPKPRKPEAEPTVSDHASQVRFRALLLLHACNCALRSGFLPASRVARLHNTYRANRFLDTGCRGFRLAAGENRRASASPQLHVTYSDLLIEFCRVFSGPHLDLVRSVMRVASWTPAA